MQGNPAVIERLNALYKAIRSTEEQAHMQEHAYESMKWGKPAHWFDAVETRIHTLCLHEVMNRINNLDGVVQPGYAFQPQCWPIEDLEQALSSMLARLGEIHQGYIALCEIAEGVDDYPTEKMAWRHQAFIESLQNKFDRRLKKLRLLGLNPYLAELAD